MSDYNGWANKETWQTWLWHGDWFLDIANEGRFGEEWDVESLEGMLQDSVWESLTEVPEGGSFLLDMVSSFMDAVDWRELAEAALENTNENNDEKTRTDSSGDQTGGWQIVHD